MIFKVACFSGFRVKCVLKRFFSENIPPLPCLSPKARGAGVGEFASNT